MQLVRHKVAMFDPMKNIKIGRDQVIEKFGVPPEKVIDVQSLIGDSVDNVPGAPGIGVKTAQQLITEYGDLDTLLARAGEIKQEKRRQTLIDFADQIRLSRQLVTLACDAPMPETIDSMAVRDPDPAVLAEFLEKMEFRTLAKRVGDGKVEAELGARQTPLMASRKAHPGRAGVAKAQADRLGAAPVAVEPGSQTFDLNAYECVQTVERLDAWIARCFEAGVIGFDTETDALSSSHADLCGVSLAAGPNQACYIPLGHVSDDGLALSGDTVTQVSLEDALKRLKPLLEDAGVLKVGQNIKYDMAVMQRHGVNVAPIDDTMLMSYVLDQGVHGHGMDDLCELFLGHQPIPFKQVAGTGKAQKSFRYVEMKPATCYAAEDADVTLRLWHILKPRLAREGPPPPPAHRLRDARARHARGAGADGVRRRQGRPRTPAPALQRVRQGHGRVGGQGPRHRRPSVQPRFAETDRRHPVRRTGPARRQEDRHRRLGHRRLDPRGTRADSRTAAHVVGVAPAVQAEGHLHRRPGRRGRREDQARAHQLPALAASSTGRSRLVRSGTCRTFPIRTETGYARSAAKPSSPTRAMC